MNEVKSCYAFLIVYSRTYMLWNHVLKKWFFYNKIPFQLTCHCVPYTLHFSIIYNPMQCNGKLMSHRINDWQLFLRSVRSTRRIIVYQCLLVNCQSEDESKWLVFLILSFFLKILNLRDQHLFYLIMLGSWILFFFIMLLITDMGYVHSVVELWTSKLKN